MKKIQLVKSAREDIENAVHYYQQSGSGEQKFKSLIIKRFDEIASFPSGLLPVKPEITSLPLSTTRKEQSSFPYHIYYSSTQTLLIVLRIFHTRQHPDKVFDYSSF